MPIPKGYRLTAEARKNIKAAMNRPDIREKMSAAANRPERKAAMKAVMNRPEVRKKRSAAQRGKPQSLRRRAANSLSSRGFPKPHTEAQILDTILRLRHPVKADRDYCQHNRMTRVEIIEYLGERDGWLCQHDECPERDADQSVPGVRLTPTTCHVDHHRPIAHGGSNDLSNLRLLHPSCNCSKGAKWEEAVRRDMVCLDSAPTATDKIEALESRSDKIEALEPRSVRSAPRLSEGSDHPIFPCPLDMI